MTADSLEKNYALIEKPIDILRFAPKEQKLETIIRAINYQIKSLTNNEITRFKNKEKYIDDPLEIEQFFREELIEANIKISDEYSELGIKRGGNRPGIIHIQEGAYALQTLGFPNSTILKYKVHDRDEELADSDKGLEKFKNIPYHLRKIKNLDSILNEKPLVRDFGFDEEIAIAAQVLSDNHMFIAKQLRNYTEKEIKGEKRRFYHIKPKQIANQFKEMYGIVTNKHLKEIIQETEKAFFKAIDSGANASQALKMINRNSIIYPEYMNHIKKYLNTQKTKKELSDNDKQRITFDLISDKLMDCINNAVDDEHMDSQRRTRRSVKEFEILKLANKYMHQLKKYKHYELLEFLFYTAGEIHTNKLINYIEYFNMKKPEETKATYYTRIKKERKQGIITGYNDLNKMKRHEQTLINIKKIIEQTTFEEDIKEYKNSEKVEKILLKAEFYNLKK